MSTKLKTGAMDPLTDVLAVAAVTGSVAATVWAAEPWGLRLNAVPGAAFHAVTAGQAWLTLDGGTPIHLLPGDAILLPTGAAHSLTSQQDEVAAPFDHAAAERALLTGEPMTVGTGTVNTQILCASYRVDPAATVAPFTLLPSVLHVPAAASSSGLRATLTLLTDEVSRPRPGTRTVLDHIVNILLVQLLRSWLKTADHLEQGPSWLRGLADPVAASALAAIHEQPDHAWTADTLASLAGVSRATLARRFTERVGTTPVGYLTDWRMELAAHRLRTGDEPLGTVARAVGYTSEYAFSRAFARKHGLPPGRYRTTKRRQAIPP